MAESLSIRVTKELPSLDEIDTAAQKLGKTRNQLVVDGINMLCTFDPDFYQMMNHVAEKHKVSVPFVMQAMLVRRLAEDAAEREIWGPHTKVLAEFMQTSDGPMNAIELYDMLFEAHCQTEGREFAKMLHEQRLQGRTLSEHESDILKKYGRNPAPDHNTPLDRSTTFWEDEDGYKEMLREEKKQ